MRIHQIHVGQGHTTFIEFDSGFRALIDCDCWDAVVDPVERLKELVPLENQARYIDLVILTHPHRDHVSGFARLADEFDLGEVWHSGHELECEDEWYQDYLKALDKTEAVVVEADEMPLLAQDGVEIRVLAPVERVVATEPDDKESRRHVHEQCIVVSVREGDSSILIAGDSRWVEWQQRIVEQYSDLLAHDLLLASHHGSRTFFTDDEDDEDPYVEGLQAISSRVVFVAVGENSHGHPHEDAINLYTQSAEAVFRTDEFGTLVAESTENGWVVEALFDTDGVAEEDPHEIYRENDESDRSGSTSSAILAGAAAGVGVALASGAIARRRDQAARRRPEPPHWGV
jgi:competence protein ComEC